MERGDIVKRRLDRWLGIPLVGFAGGLKAFGRLFPSTAFSPENTRSIGILCLGAIGDLLLTTALIQALRRKFPDAVIDIITSKANGGTHGFIPGIDGAAAFGVTDVPGMVRHLRSKKYNLLIDTSQWARLGALLSAVSGAGHTVGFATKSQFRHYAYDSVVTHRNDVHEVENFLALGKAVFPGIDGKPEILLPENPSLSCPACLRDPSDKKMVFCHMWPSGLNSYLKEWPAEYWAELAGILVAAGYAPVFTGGPQDAERTEKFIENYALAEKGICSVAGAASLADIAWSMRHVAAVVSVNTGIMHLAAVAGAATVGLNGPTNPSRWGPLGDRTISLQPREGHYGYLNLGFEYPDTAGTVLNGLPVEDVVAALKRLDLGL